MRIGMGSIYDAYDKKSDTQGLGWADQWDYKYNDKYGSGEGAGSTQKGEGSGKEKLAKVKAAASVGVDKTKSMVTTGAQKVKSGTSNGIKWIKDKVQKKPNQQAE